MAPPADMPAVLKLASELDQPVNPELEFQVFRLHYGYAAAVARSVTEFYKSPQGAGHLGERLCRRADQLASSCRRGRGTWPRWDG